jgi:methyl-accepting chemotaxis protein
VVVFETKGAVMNKVAKFLNWRNMALAARFRLLMACTVLPCALLLGFYVKDHRASIQFSDQELKGDRMVEALLKLRLQPWQGGKAPQQGREEAQKAQALYGSELRTEEAWQEMEKALDGPALGAAGIPVAARQAWAQLYSAVADGSNLILDPDLDTYYLMDAVCLTLAQQREMLDGVADILVAAKRGVAGPKEIFRVEAALADLKRGAQVLRRNFKVIFEQEGGGREKNQLADPLEQYTNALEKLAARGALLDSSNIKMTQGALAQAQGTGEIFWSASLGSLDRLIAVRVHGLQHGMAVALASTLGILALAFLLSRGVIGGVLGPLQHLTHEVSLLQDGDLRQRAYEAGDDEMGRFVQGVDALRRRLVEVPQILAGAAERLSSSVDSMKQDHLVQGSILESQASALAQTQVTSEEIRQTSKQAAAQAQVLIVEAGKARELTRTGGEALGKSLDSLLAIRSRVELLAADVEALESRARRIEGIIDSVKDLADQSNLLALNAAIEAMRAGAQGQGFGLVAHEIRALADQSIAATEQVRQVLGDLNDGVRDAAKASRQGVHDIQKGLERVQGSAETLADIQDSVGESVGQLQRIAAVVQQQDTGLNQVFLALKDQNDRMMEAMRQQEKTAKAVTLLEEAADTVETVVKGFKT